MYVFGQYSQVTEIILHQLAQWRIMYKHVLQLITVAVNKTVFNI